jgi:hypothetical protein
MARPHEYLIPYLADEAYISEANCLDEKPQIINSYGMHDIDRGFLVLTSQRMFFVKQAFWPSKDVTIQYTVNLEDATVSEGNKRIVVLNKLGQKKEFRGKELPNFFPQLRNQIAKRIEEVQAAREKERRMVVLDFSSLKETMSKGGLIMTTLKCPSCGRPQALPQNGSSFICEYCKSPITAVDVFEKIKGLL